MSLDSYVTLGTSGLRVSPLCLGTMTFGNPTWGSNEEDSHNVLQTYIERGGNFVDTANGYTAGASENYIGSYLKARDGLRDRLVLATKFGGNLISGDPNGGGGNRKAIIQQAEASLRRLGTDYIDFYWLHHQDRHTRIEETIFALDSLVRSGKVRYYGISDSPAWEVAKAAVTADFRGWERPSAIQIEYSLLERTVEGELIPMALDLGLGVTPWGPLKGGILSGKYSRQNADQEAGTRNALTEKFRNERTFQLLDALERIAKNQEATVANVALAWLRSRPGVSSTIIGARTVDQLEKNLSALDVTLTSDQKAELNALTQPELNFPAAFLNLVPAWQQGGVSVNGVPGA